MCAWYGVSFGRTVAVAPPGPGRLDIEPHLLFERLQVELHEVGKTALQHEIRHAAGELRGLVRIASETDRDFAGAPVDAYPLISVSEHIGELIAEPPVADAEIIREAERPRPARRIAQRSTENVTENFR